MSTRGCDSAGEPTPAQARSARSLGITWWAFYIAGPGALHNWSDKGTTVIKDAGLLPLPIYVPRMGNGLIASRTPEVDAETFVAAYHSRGIDGAGVLDTEASMRDDPWTAQYERRFSAKMMLLRQAPITYAGGFSMQAPPSAPYKWWVVASTSPGTDEAFQEGQGDLAGIAVDFDYAGAQFPFAHFGFKPHPKLTPEVEEMFVRNPDTGEICLCGPSGAVNLGNDWTAVEAAYGAAGVPLVVVESASLQAAFLHIASHGPA
ncbi:MAG TPA: hypothetical protein VFN61_05535 [Acidimicrobiales bacterium]|nr:hypothetical protein [Acidimicrobiales bacterium]